MATNATFNWGTRLSPQIGQIVKLLNCFFVVTLIVWSCVGRTIAPISAQEPDKTPTANILLAQRAELDQRFAEKTKQLGLAQQASPWFFRRDPQRQYVFLPQEKVLPVESRELRTLLDEYADALFTLTKKQAALKNGTVAYRLLHEVLFYNPNHEGVRKILGHRKNDDGWHVSSDRLTIRAAKKKHPTLDWPAKSFQRVSTPHFEISSQADEKTTKRLAEKLEIWHAVWRQVFFEFWGSPSSLARWVEGKRQASRSSKKYRVVFFKDKQSYVEQLQSRTPGIERSTGYYNDRDKLSYFYASESPSAQDTWRHELTHQLFQESRRGVTGPFIDEFLWLGEGIALYFESLTEFGDYVTLGGFDSRRMQFARLRRVKEQFYVPLDQLSKMPQEDFQANENVAKLYSQAAGITHYLMDSDNGKLQSALCQFLRLSYRGALKSDSFVKIIGKTYQEIDAAYEPFVRINSQQIDNFLVAPKRRTELSLVNSSISNASIEKIAECTNLKWLDCSAMDLRNINLGPLVQCKNLQQVFFTGSLLRRRHLAELSQLDSLTELDLSGCSLADADLVELAAFSKLESLSLVGTKLTDACLPFVSQIQNLKSLDVRNTKITGNGLQTLLAKHPDVSISN